MTNTTQHKIFTTLTKNLNTDTTHYSHIYADVLSSFVSCLFHNSKNSFHEHLQSAALSSCKLLFFSVGHILSNFYKIRLQILNTPLFQSIVQNVLLYVLYKNFSK